MVVALATEKQSWSDAELRDLSEQIRRGDLTPVLKIYEGDIKSPVRSALSGTLIRSLLIQVQKAKVKPVVFAFESTLLLTSPAHQRSI
jgi:nuclear-control-of-ATPase protein 2